MGKSNLTDWEGLYQQGDTGWDRGTISPALEYWLNSGDINPEQRMLIPGCGRGHEVVELARLGFDVTGLDLAPSAIFAIQQSLQKSASSATLVCDDLFNFQPASLFDAVYEQTCMCAIPPEQRKGYVSCLRNWLKPKGSLFLLMMQTGKAGGPPFHCDYLDMHDLFDEKHWEWESEVPLVIPRPQASERFELGFILHRKEGSS